MGPFNVHRSTFPGQQADLFMTSLGPSVRIRDGRDSSGERERKCRDPADTIRGPFWKSCSGSATTRTKNWRDNSSAEPVRPGRTPRSPRDILHGSPMANALVL